MLILLAVQCYQIIYWHIAHISLSVSFPEVSFADNWSDYKEVKAQVRLVKIEYKQSYYIVLLSTLHWIHTAHTKQKFSADFVRNL